MKKVKQTIEQVEQAQALHQIRGVKKLRGVRNTTELESGTTASVWWPRKTRWSSCGFCTERTCIAIFHNEFSFLCSLLFAREFRTDL
jgi:hypothetical protein